MTRIFVEEPFSVSLISGIENFYAYAGIFTFSIKNLFSHTTEKLRRVTLLCFTNFLVSEKLWIRGEDRGSITIFGHNFFSQSAKSFRREPFSVSLFSGMEKFFAYEGNFTIFYRNFFCLTVPKTL